MKPKEILIWILRLVPAFIMLQTLYFKFSGQPESIFIFTTVGIEPWGRIATGVAELCASVLLLYPRTTVLGALFGSGIMSGAIFSHVLILGIVVQGDGGLLFAYACVTLTCCLSLILIFKHQIQALGRFSF